ncbi:hypothetical protein [Nitrospirillum sp. BR 11828]|uniref:hypothetical protein n=1 Tax=Nitrospirillum sp. BR 11828 TaxID=3104325 RepID=UPI002ACAF870|nr:hypothetical protein [Nitrospirillum sp. BR 11828]MDZ5650219.1 hypothetical protein [Nitrospirillum sp. BR 11828]
MMSYSLRNFPQSFHQSLIERAVQVAERKGIIFIGESAERINSFALAESERVVGVQNSNQELTDQSAGGRDDRVGGQDTPNLPGSWNSLDLYEISLRIMKELVELAKKNQMSMGTKYIKVRNGNYVIVSNEALQDAIRNLCRKLGNPWPFCQPA